MGDDDGWQIREQTIDNRKNQSVAIDTLYEFY